LKHSIIATDGLGNLRLEKSSERGVSHCILFVNWKDIRTTRLFTWTSFFMIVRQVELPSRAHCIESSSVELVNYKSIILKATYPKNINRSEIVACWNG
jgi:hypothetical protein